MGDFGAIQMLVRSPRVDVIRVNHQQKTPLLLHFERYGRYFTIEKKLLILEALLFAPIST